MRRNGERAPNGRFCKSDKKPHPKKAAFLAVYAEVASITEAAKAAGIDRSTHYAWLEKDAKYKRSFAGAQEQACDVLEREARRRAAEGVNEPVIYKGELMGVWVNGDGETVSEGTEGAILIPLTVKKYSDTLLIFLLKGALPDKYKDRLHQTVDIRSEAERIASEYDLDPDELIRKAGEIANGH